MGFEKRAFVKNEVFQKSWWDSWCTSLTKVSSNLVRVMFCVTTFTSTRALHFPSAAHCVTVKQTGIVSQNVLTIYAGLHEIKKLNASHVQKRKVVKIINHKNFDFNLFESDLALLKLDREIRISHYARPVCLPERPE